MATAARFGRLPRRSPSLTATIVAAAQQYAAMRERNIQDAWQNGGDFEGKKVTDEMLIAFFEEKLAGLDPNDPAANEVRNQLSQYEFSIANSKMELKYAQKKVSDTQMASFYKEWAGKLPPDSEAYRERMRLAAGYADRANTAARGASAQAKANAYGRAQDANYKSTGYAYDAVTSAILSAARSGIIGMVNPVLNTMGENWADLRVNENDATNFLEIANMIASDPNLEEWRRQTTAEIRKADPSFNGDFSYNALMALNRKAASGATKAIQIARRNGYSPTAYQKKRDEIKGTGIAISTIDEKAIYEDARREFTETINDPSATIAERWEANNKYGQTLLSLANRAKTAGDDIGAGRYNTEYLATRGEKEAGGSPTMWESSRPTEAARSSDGKSDAETTADSVRSTFDSLSKLLLRGPNGEPLYVQVYMDSKGNPTSAQTGKMGIALASAVPNGAFYVNDNDANGYVTLGGSKVKANSIVTAVIPMPVTASVIRTDPATGNPTGEKSIVTDPVTIGNKYVLPNGDRFWTYVDRNGDTKYALDNPFQTDPKPTSAGDEIVIPAFDDKTAAQYKSKGVTPQAMLKPDYYEPELSKRMPTSVVSSLPAAEMIMNPKTAYAKYTPQTTRELALAQSGGDFGKFNTMWRELDALRGDYVSSGNMTYDEKIRLRNANMNGDLPLMSDYISSRDLGARDMPAEAYTGEEVRAIDRMLQQPIYTGSKGSSVADDYEMGRKRELAARTKSTYSNPFAAGPGITAQSSRDMANNLVGSIWQSVFSTPAPTTPVTGPDSPSRWMTPQRPPGATGAQPVPKGAPPPAAIPKPKTPPPPKDVPPPKPDLNPYQNIFTKPPKVSAPKQTFSRFGNTPL